MELELAGAIPGGIVLMMRDIALPEQATPGFFKVRYWY